MKTGLCSCRRWLEACNFGLRTKRNCTICVAKTKALISCAVTAQLICAFVFAWVRIRYSHDATHMIWMVYMYFIFYKKYFLQMCFRSGISRVKLEQHPTRTLEIVEQSSLPQEFEHEVAQAISRYSRTCPNSHLH